MKRVLFFLLFPFLLYAQDGQITKTDIGQGFTRYDLNTGKTTGLVSKTTFVSGPYTVVFNILKYKNSTMTDEIKIVLNQENMKDYKSRWSGNTLFMETSTKGVMWTLNENVIYVYTIGSEYDRLMKTFGK